MIRLADILHATGATLHGPAFSETFSDFCYDTRLLVPGDLFLAVVTERGDGHDYVHQAAAMGASGVLCQRPFDLEQQGVTCITVEDTRAALLDWARYSLRRLGPWVIGVTGSSGKTTTKELVSAVLSTRYRTFRNRGNLNTTYGLPISLGRLQPEHQIAVLELACDGVDQIRDLSALILPRIGVITNVNETHLASLGSLENIARENGRLLEVLPAARDGGAAILNYDDPRVRAMASRTAARVITYGRSPDAHLVAGDVQADASGVAFTVFIRDFFPIPGIRGERRLRVRLPLLGAHNVYSALAAVAVGLVLDVSLAQALEALTNASPLPGRLKPLAGLNGSLILDDTFSASPASTLVALDALDLYKEGRRLVVLGDLLDLGGFEEEAFRTIGEALARVAHHVVAHGDVAHRIAAHSVVSGLGADVVHSTFTIADTVRIVTESLRPGDTVLVKGATESRLEKVVAALLAEPERASTDLVRQTAGWQQVRIVRPGRPTWLDVDLDAIAHNVRRVVDIVGPAVSVLAVLKADAYGHGITRVARTALNNGARYLGVASVNEGVLLRQSGVDAPILVLGYTPSWQARELALNGLTATVYDLAVVRALSQASRELDRQIRIHVKVDTGMGRLGLLPDAVLPFFQELRSARQGSDHNLFVEGIFTHFSVADADRDYTLWQVDGLRKILSQLEACDLRPPLVHAANSAAILTLPESHYDMVRLGIAMYGLHPSELVKCPSDFRPALSFMTQVAQVKTLPIGSYVSYGNTYQTTSERRVAVIPVGYADGFRRAPQHWREVLVGGQRAPIIGRVCMDQTMIDVSHIAQVRQGDEVVLIGTQGDESITAEDVARHLGTINYEVVSEILARVPRIV